MERTWLGRKTLVRPVARKRTVQPPAALAEAGMDLWKRGLSVAVQPLFRGRIPVGSIRIPGIWPRDWLRWGPRVWPLDGVWRCVAFWIPCLVSRWRVRVQSALWLFLVMPHGLQMEENVLPDGTAGLDEVRLLPRLGRQIGHGSVTDCGMADVQRPGAPVPPVLGDGRGAPLDSAHGSHRRAPDS